MEKEEIISKIVEEGHPIIIIQKYDNGDIKIAEFRDALLEIYKKNKMLKNALNTKIDFWKKTTGNSVLNGVSKSILKELKEIQELIQ